MKAKHTPGPVCIVGGDNNGFTVVCKPGDGLVTHIARLNDQWICDEHGGTAFENAVLIKEAFDVASETGLTPRQLAEQRPELLEVARMARERLNAMPAHLRVQSEIDELDNVIAKATGA